MLSNLTSHQSSLSTNHWGGKLSSSHSSVRWERRMDSRLRCVMCGKRERELRRALFCSALIYKDVCTLRSDQISLSSDEKKKKTKVSKVEMIIGPTAHTLSVEWDGRCADRPFLFFFVALPLVPNRSLTVAASYTFKRMWVKLFS